MTYINNDTKTTEDKNTTKENIKVGVSMGAQDADKEEDTDDQKKGDQVE